MMKQNAFFIFVSLSRVIHLFAAVFVAMSLVSCEDAPFELPNPHQLNPVDFVDPIIGTGGGGYGQPQTFVGPAYPLGMTRPGPDTSGNFPRGIGGFAHTSGYWYLDRYIDGFSQMHFSGTGAEDYGNFLLMPTRGSVENRFNEDGYRQQFSHRNEEAKVGHYAVTLDDYDIKAEITAGIHSSFHRYTYNDSDETLPPTLIIDVGHGIGRHGALDGHIEWAESINEDGRLVLEGWMLSAGRFTGEENAFNLYFSMTVSANAPLNDVLFIPFVDEKPTSGMSASGVDVGATLTFSPAVTKLEVRMGISFIGVEQARVHRAEVDASSFEQVRIDCEEIWKKRLGKIELDEAVSEKIRIMFYTNLYHASLMPTLMSEYAAAEDGRYVGLDQEIHDDNGRRAYSDLSMWDTYRTVHPLFTWLYPDDSANLATTLLRMADEIGHAPRWPLAVNETGTMLGAPASIILSDTYLRGVENFDLAKARRVMLDDAKFVEGKTIRGNAYRCFEEGFCPADEMGRAVANAIEYGWADFALANFLRASSLSDTDDVFIAELNERKKVWRAHFDKETGFIRGKNLDGTWTYANDFEPTKDAEDYAEGNAWQYTFGAFFDAQGFVSVFETQEAALEKLEALFFNAEPLAPIYVVDEIRAPDPYYWHSNEPDLHAALLFSLLGAPDKSAKWLNWIQQTKHDDTPFGLDGNDDAGTLSAWYVWSVLGLYPLAGSDLWVLNAPSTSYSVKMGSGYTLNVQKEGNGLYVGEVIIDEMTYSKPWILHQDLAAASTITFRMSESPTRWGQGQVYEGAL